VNHLVHTEAVPQQLATMHCRGIANFAGASASRRAGDLATAHRIRGLLNLQRPDELVKEQRDSVRQLVVSGFWRPPLTELVPASIDEFGPIGSQKFVQHSRGREEARPRWTMGSSSHVTRHSCANAAHRVLSHMASGWRSRTGTYALSVSVTIPPRSMRTQAAAAPSDR